jgi:hypothetical protein
MPLLPDIAIFQQTLGALPLATFQAGDTVFAAGSRTNLLLILRSGAATIVKDGIEIAKVSPVPSLASFLRC